MLINGNLRTNIVPLGTIDGPVWDQPGGKEKRTLHPQKFHELMGGIPTINSCGWFMIVYEVTLLTLDNII